MAEPNLISALDEVCWLELSGPDTGEFLQSQLTSDIESLTDDANAARTQLGAWCSPKGRVLCLFRVVRFEPERFALRLPTSLAQNIVKRLRMFILRRNVKVELADWTSVGIALTDHPSVDKLTMQAGEVVQFEDGFAYAVEGEMPRWEFVSYTGGIETPRRVLGLAEVSLGTVEAWRLYDIRSRIPYVDEQTTDKFVPQMLDLHNIGAVSFEKGCYPGQEIVARTQYRGTLKRRLANLKADNAASEASTPTPGLRIFADLDASEAIAEVVSAERSGNNWEMLAVIRSENPPAEDLRVELGEKPVLLPFDR